MAEGVSIMLLPPILALCASFFTKCLTSSRILRYGGAYFCLVFLVGLTLDKFCGFRDFSFGTCDLFSDSAIGLFSFVHMYSIGAYVILAPILLVVSIVIEVNLWRDEYLNR